MTEKDKIIASLRKQLEEENRKTSALVQEVELLKYENNKLKHTNSLTE